ncbi:hypothetical protein Hoch_0964 [Haliangium ochraceum DSM 14365]|uniref:RepB-like DNA primase domain-containing protein n=1 Tax=Haliangium ochraceum (strain DSM 14365 / JCM 11303 / SMP-2) TaxID=502025 RepID=D0LQK7_HALO1|nr:hypothetical protein Hoch_0964 [Haliangium ochraceum DSM 14365]
MHVARGERRSVSCPLNVSIIIPSRSRWAVRRRRGLSPPSLRIGYFDSEESFVRACAEASGTGQVYVGIQPRPVALLAQANNELRRLKHGARDDEIETLTALVIDIDPVRPKDTASTEAELDRAIACGDRISDWLVRSGFERPVRNMSGNGCQLWFAVPAFRIMPLRRDHMRNRLKAFEARIREKFQGDGVAIDSIYNFSRIIKVIGTLSVKGEPTAERPHRLSRSLDPFRRREDAVLLESLLLMPLEERASSASVMSHATKAPAFAIAPQISSRVRGLLDTKVRLRALFEGRGKTAIGLNGKPLDTSSSGYDFSVAFKLALLGVIDPNELATALWHRPDGHARAKGEAYIRRTAQEALEAAVSACPQRLGSVYSPGGPQLPQIRTNGRQLREIIAEARSAFATANQTRLDVATEHGAGAQDLPVVFVQGNVVVALSHPAKAPPELASVPETTMFGLLTRDADWLQIYDDAPPMPTYPPKEVARDLLAFPGSEIPRVDAVITTPTFGQDGTLLTASGLHREEQLWLEPDPTLHVLEVPALPSAEEVRAARDLIVNDLLVDFPFLGQPDRAHAVAALLLPFVRRMIFGCTPLHMVEAPNAGSGKGLLCHLISIVTTGKGMDGCTLPGHEEEVRKSLTAELAKGCPIIVLDNAQERTMLDSAALASVLTAPTWRSRILGKSEIVILPNWALWMLTGNNPRISTELSRRCVRIRIDPKQEQAWRRSGFKHDPIIPWAYERRGELVHAALVLVQAWIAVGKPRGTERLGSFEHWAAVMSGILQVAGVPGFLGNLDAMYAEADSDGEHWKEFFTAWWEAFQDEGKRVSELNAFCEERGLLDPMRGSGNTRAQETRLGRALQTARDRMYGGLRLTVQRTGRGRRYSLVRNAVQAQVMLSAAAQQAEIDPWL